MGKLEIEIMITMKKLLLLLLLLTQLTYAQKDESVKTLSGSGYGNIVNSVAFSPDGKKVLSGSADNTLKMWDIATGKCLKTLSGHSGSVRAVAISPDGKNALSGSSDYTLKLWNIATGKCLKTFTGHSENVMSVSYSPDGKTALSVSWDKTLKLWNIGTGQCLKTFTGHTDALQSVAFSPDGLTSLSGSYDKTLKLWDIATGQCLKTLSGHGNIVNSVAFSPDGKTALSGSDDATIILWDIATGQCLKTFTGHKNWVHSVTFSPDGLTALSGACDNTIILWDIATGKCLKTLTGHTSFVNSVTFSSDGKTALSGSWDTTLKLWDLSKYVNPTEATKPVIGNKPPILAINNSSIRFTDANGNNAINAFEDCKLTFEVSNTGTGNGYKLQKRVTLTGTTSGISTGDNSVFTLNAGEKKIIEIPVKANGNTETGNITLTFKIDEANGFGTDEYTIEVPTRKFISPLVEVADFTVTGSNGSNLKKKSPFDLQVLVQNTQQGLAENVKVELQIPANVICLSANEVQSFSTLKGGETKSIVYSLIVSDLYQGQTIPISIKLSEKMGKYGQNKSLTLNLDQALASAKITLTAKPDDNTDISITKGSLNADVDVNIPSASATSDKTFVVIIANENYTDEARVDHAINDGTIFKQYCEKALGMPVANIHFVKDATYGKLIAEKDWLVNNLKAYKGEAKALFYYAGHGIPGGQDQPAYLLPVDGSSSNVTSALMLDDLYSSLTQNASKGVTVFLDACFSGSTRDAGMLASARGTKLKPRESTLRGNMVVFSAASGDETAWPYKDKQHGMFTYYLLKKLQETKGDVSYKELADYINDNVYKTAIKLNNKPQTPTIKAGADALDWENWKLK
jgi:WD40 repeat protein